MCSLQRILATHRHVKSSARLGRTGVQDDDPGRKLARHLSRALKPKRIARDIDQVAGLLYSERKADHITSLDTNGTMARRRGSHNQALTTLSFEETGFEWSNADGIST